MLPAVKIGDEFQDQYGVWVVDHAEGNCGDCWGIWLRSRGRHHMIAVGGSSLRRHYVKVKGEGAKT